MRSRARRDVLLGGVLGAAIGVAASLAMAQPQEASSPPPFVYTASGKRDPFMPLVRDGRIVTVTGSSNNGHQVSGDFGAPKLGGIIYDTGGKSIALINETEVMVGQMVGDYEVVAIRKDEVVLIQAGQVEPLVLRISFDEPAKKDVAD